MYKMFHYLELKNTKTVNGCKLHCSQGVIRLIRGQDEGGIFFTSHNKGSFNNYVDKKLGVSRKLTLGHLTKGRYQVKYPQWSTQGGGGSTLGKIWST